MARVSKGRRQHFWGYMGLGYADHDLMGGRRGQCDC